MANGSSVIIDLDPGWDFNAENRTTSELISMLKHRFRDADFAKVESILMARERKLKQELETTESDYWELIQEKNTIYERERKAENEIEVWKRRYEGLESRIFKLETDLKILSSVEPNARVSSENGNNVEVENGFVRTDLAEENFDLARANMDHTVEDSRRPPPCRSIVQIIESDDDCTSGDILRPNEMTSQRVANSDRSTQTSVQLGTGMLKRKQDSCLNVSENKNSNNDGYEDKDVYDNALTVDCKTAKVQKLIHRHDGSPVNHCSKIAASSRSNNVEKFCTPSSQEPEIFRQCGEKMGAEPVSQNLTRESLFDVPGICSIDESSSSSSSSND